mmetsp:Transcript_182/g.273  ORF Transcript_182/g.273 Transcript_182/m.273 type:complete len:218 (+) Transcript_182:65-718(+)
MNFVVESNNHGAALFDDGYFTEASAVLQQTLRTLVRVTDGSHEATAESQINIKHKRKDSRVPVQYSNSPSSSFVYQKTLRISYAREIDAPLASCAVLFNLALAKHMNALQVPCSSKKTTLLSSASKLYKMAYETLPDNDAEEATISNLIIALAVLNNLGHIYHEIGEYEVSRLFLDDLSNLCISSKDDHKFAEIAQDIDGLFLNSVLLRTPDMAAAA